MTADGAWRQYGLERTAEEETPARRDPAEQSESAAVATPGGPAPSSRDLYRVLGQPARAAAPDAPGYPLGGRAYGELSSYQLARTERFGEPELFTERQRQLEALNTFAGAVNALTASGLGMDEDLALAPRDALRRINARVDELFAQMGWRR